MRILAACVLVAACASSSPRALTPVAPAAAQLLPSLSYKLVSGADWTSESARGQVVVIDVWATYCKPCRQAFPKLDRLSHEPGVVVVGISVDEDDAVVAAYLREVPASFAIARDPQRTVQAAPLRLTALPTVLVIDPRGRLRLRADKMTEDDYDALPALVAQLRAEP